MSGTFMAKYDVMNDRGRKTIVTKVMIKIALLWESAEIERSFCSMDRSRNS